MFKFGDELPMLKVKLLSSDAQLPVRAESGSAGYDLFASEAIVVPTKGRCLVKTDIAIEIPDGTYARVAPLSLIHI